MTKETIFQQIENLVKPHFTTEVRKFLNVAISPYYPIIVVEFYRKLANTESNRNAYEEYYETLNGKFIWCMQLMHYQLNEFEGLNKLYNKYLNAN